MLKAHHVQLEEYHGLSGESVRGKAVLKNEIVKTFQHGVFSCLADYLGEPRSPTTYTLFQLLQTATFVHRAFCLTYRSTPDLFIPIENPHFVTKPSSVDSWFCAEIPSRYQHGQTLRTMPPGFELDAGATQPWMIRAKARFEWPAGNRAAGVAHLTKYHRKIRKMIRPIVGSPVRWYLRRDIASVKAVQHSELPTTLAALHRLSELARYHPLTMRKHLSGQHGWLLAEFLKSAPPQFVVQVASEITGLYFHRPYTADL